MTSDGGLLALAISRIHRCDTLAALTQPFLSVAPTVVDADAFGLYLLDERLQPRVIYAARTDRGFLAEYERLRMSDPCFLHVLNHRSFIHTRELLGQRAWMAHPLQHLMARWGLRYSIESPLIAGGRLAGTLNIARCDRGYFESDGLSRARFLCEEAAYAFERLVHLGRLEQELACACSSGTRAAERRPGHAGAEPAYVRIAADLIQAHCAEPLTLERLAAAGGVSPRTLLEGFRRWRGTSPKTMLRDLRFASARKALLAAQPETATVADIATTCGFYELGRFAVEYRRRYGEPPSATLRRRAAADEPEASPVIVELSAATARAGAPPRGAGMRAHA